MQISVIENVVFMQITLSHKTSSIFPVDKYKLFDDSNAVGCIRKSMHKIATILYSPTSHVNKLNHKT